MERRQKAWILKDLKKKLVFVVGPRQVGKTWLAKDIGKGFSNTVYLNYDRYEDRAIIKREGWLKTTEFLILDELHKMPGWKRFLKGVFDTKPESLRIAVTGSARLDLARKAGDSLAGRFFVHRLLPFSPAELSATEGFGDIDRFCSRGGFPEPFLAESAMDADRWRLQYVDGLIREDVVAFERIQDLRAIQLVLDLLRTRVGSPVSYRSIATDIEVAPNTVKKYLQILEALYIVFRVTPYSKNVARSLLKNPKLYFYDTGMVRGDQGAVFENLSAVCLLKHVLAKTDYQGKEHQLHYLRTKEGKEVDFCIIREGNPELLVESKYAESGFDKSLMMFSNKLGVPGVQVVKDLKRERQTDAVEMRMAERFFRELFL
jgi:predicted AAA+ superfamily ATPase